jgi:hypothetical protein
MTPWFSDPDPGVQGLGSGAITRSADKLAYDAPDGIHLLTMTGWPICTSATDQLIIPGASEPYFGAADAHAPPPLTDHQWDERQRRNPRSRLRGRFPTRVSTMSTGTSSRPTASRQTPARRHPSG